MISAPSNIDRNDVQSDQHESLVLAAQSGDQESTETLYHSVISALRNWSRAFSATVDYDEALAVSSLAFYEAVMDFVPGDGSSFIGLLQGYVQSSLTDAGRFSGGSSGSGVQVSVPERTLKRFHAILREADYDLDKGIELARQHSMNPSTFLDIYRASADMGSEEDDLLAVASAESVSDLVEETVLLDAAWSSVNNIETTVCERYYGFTDYREHSDAEIAEGISFTRSKVQRTRTGALDKMRMAVGLEGEAKTDRRLSHSDLVAIASSHWEETGITDECVYCGGSFDHVDHVYPLARGGRDNPMNLVPACQSCNTSKGSKTLPEWLRTNLDQRDHLRANYPNVFEIACPIP